MIVIIIIIIIIIFINITWNAATRDLRQVKSLNAFMYSIHLV